MNNERIPFDIPAIDNRKAALALHLGVDSENQDDWDSIIEVKIHDLAAHEKAAARSSSVFEFKNARYYVDHISSGMQSESVVAFNSNHWAIKKASASAIECGNDGTSRWSIKSPADLPATIRLREAHC